jgi:PBP1b-binding outer membrane lipoprotein LpoB
MKKFLLVLVVFLFAFVGCVTAPAPVEKLQKQVVFDFPAISKEKLFNKTNQWVAEKFTSANNVIQYKDLKEGKIICQIVTSVYAAMYMENINFNTTMTIEIKDNRSRITLLAHSMTNGNYGNSPIPDFQQNIDYAKESYDTILTGYKEYILDKSESKDNW